MDGSRSRAREAPPVAAFGGPAWTRALFATWAERPLPALAPWALGSLAIGLTLLGAALLVAALSAYSLLSQAWRLGHELASAAHTLGYTPAGLLLRLSPHAVPELTAVFLPLAACLSLVRRRRHDDLAAAALLTAIVAFPVVVCAAGIEVFLTPYVA